ncbi:TolC family protein [Bermanella sp. R86510]|jgi:cobalt-zinc-cadmium efflux system outer membrane protein|uniref:TolC family protein n=1 Tax=unclassified Bermanella TaxID=2627862 RepID=UPI0037C85636
MHRITLNRYCTSCVWLAFLLFNLSIAANADTALTLKEALTRTLAKNPQLYQYTFIQEATRAQRQTSALRPALELELAAENFAGSNNNKGFDSAEITLALSSVIELGGKREARLSFADARIIQAEWEKKATTLDVLGELTASYIESLTTQANIQLAEESLALSQSLLKTVNTRSNKGATPEAEVMRAQAAVTRAELQLAALTSKLQRQKVLLARFWGGTSPEFSHLNGNLFEFDKNESFDQLYARIKTSPSLHVFASEVRIKDAEITLARTNGRSDITWRAGIRRFEETGDSALTAGLSIPLFASKRNRGEVKAALAERNAIEYAKQDTLLRLHAKLFEAWSLRNQNMEAVMKMEDTAIPALEKAFQLTKKAYENGRYRYQDLVAAQEELLATKQALIDAATNVQISQVLIEQLTGTSISQ